MKQNRDFSFVEDEFLGVDFSPCLAFVGLWLAAGQPTRGWVLRGRLGRVRRVAEKKNRDFINMRKKLQVDFLPCSTLACCWAADL
jgi:hypothetical protein